MKIGSRTAVLSLVTAAIVATLLSSPVIAGKKKEKAAAEYSVVAGTVFRQPGFALVEASVTLAAVDQSGSASGKKLQFSTNTRGEFAFRVPAIAAKYIVAASAKGFSKEQKTVEVQPSERVDVTFMLAPESK